MILRGKQKGKKTEADPNTKFLPILNGRNNNFSLCFPIEILFAGFCLNLLSSVFVLFCDMSVFEKVIKIILVTVFLHQQV